MFELEITNGVLDSVTTPNQMAATEDVAMPLVADNSQTMAHLQLSEEAVMRFQAAMERPLADNAVLQQMLETMVEKRQPFVPVQVKAEEPQVMVKESAPVAVEKPVVDVEKSVVVGKNPIINVEKTNLAEIEKPVVNVEKPVVASTQVIVDNEAPKVETPKVTIAEPKTVVVEVPKTLVEKPTITIQGMPEIAVDKPTVVVAEKPVVASTQPIVVNEAPKVDTPKVAIAEPKVTIVEQPAMVAEKPTIKVEVTPVVVSDKQMVEEDSDIVVQANPMMNMPLPTTSVESPTNIMQAAPVVSASVMEKIEAVTASEVLIEAATAVADTMLVTPGLMRGEGEIKIQLKQDVLAGTELKIVVASGTLTVEFAPSVERIADLLQRSQGQLVQVLSERVGNYNIAVNVRSAHLKGTRYGRG